ncbi:DUF6449 domain-containing protein [Lachnotalea glycerini]|uniref:DUF6449 domain-containing protein n=1 Tax=Lachnotalea glycerini TaxID=1763509 RepID=A0A371JEL3_9FIRM|nr:DUF6449 domain-containing protein [Lachnotalea glycerini]RDY31107.1 hypothetical protein CG710_011545 [Lachnotalea glycerini]
MTSKSLYFNLLKEDIKRRIWTLSLSMLVFFVGLPIHVLLRLNRIKKILETVGIEKARLGYASFANNDGIGILLAITAAGAIICGISGFSYLYSKSKVDLYHSIPVKREKLFVITYINGVIIYVVPYLINILIYFMIGASKQYLSGVAIRGAMFAFAVNLIGYLFIYSVTIVAVMMTGNLIVGILGTAVFMVYAPILLLVKSVLYQTFFTTYSAAGETNNYLAYVSPVFAYNQLVNYMGKSGFATKMIGLILGFIIASVLGALLYKFRPSEAAGKSMAFKITQAPIKILIVLPTALVGGLLLMTISETSSFVWMLFGVIFISFLSHGMIEIIYNSDFKCIIENKIQLVLCMMLSVVIVGSAKLDLAHYNTYIPKEDKIESISIDLEYFEKDINYYDKTLDLTNNYNNYIDSTVYKLKNMKLTDIKNTYQFIQYAIANNVDTKKLQHYSFQTYTSFTVKYNLKNNKTAYRRYTVNITDAMDYFNQLYDDDTYKECVYQILSLDKSLVNVIQYYNVSNGIDEAIKLSVDEKQELLNLLCEDIRSLTATEVAKSVPVTELILRLGENNVKQSYYIYPEFTKTIEFMKSLGISLDSSIDTKNIASIIVTDYNYEIEEAENSEDYDSMFKTYKFTEKKEIEEIANALESGRLIYNNINIPSNLNACIIYNDGSEDNEFSSINIEELPESIRQEMGY